MSNVPSAKSPRARRLGSRIFSIWKATYGALQRLLQRRAPRWQSPQSLSEQHLSRVLITRASSGKRFKWRITSTVATREKQPSDAPRSASLERSRSCSWISPHQMSAPTPVARASRACSMPHSRPERLRSWDPGNFRPVLSSFLSITTSIASTRLQQDARGCFLPPWPRPWRMPWRQQLQHAQRRPSAKAHIHVASREPSSGPVTRARSRRSRIVKLPVYGQLAVSTSGQL